MNRTEILELNKMKNSLESRGIRRDYMEERISNWEDKNLEMIQLEEGIRHTSPQR